MVMVVGGRAVIYIYHTVSLLDLLSLNSRLVSKNPFQQNEFEFGLLKALVYHQ